MTDNSSALLPTLNYGTNVINIDEKEFDNKGALQAYKAGIVVVAFVSNYSRFSISMQNDFKRFADSAIQKSLAKQILILNVTSKPNVISMSKGFPYKIDQFPLIIFYADGLPCFKHDADYTFDALMSNLLKVMSANVKCALR